jgi:hypothetical protein
MFFHDSDHKYEPMMFEYRLAAKYKVKFVASDDIGAGNAGAVWNDFLKEHNYKEVARGRRCAIAQKI